VTSHRILLLLTGLVLAGCSSEGPGTPDGSSDGTTSDVSASDAQPVDAGADGDGSCFGTFGDAACWACDRNPTLALTWNASCGADPATGYLVEWGPYGADAYPDSLDAGDPCEAGAGYPECVEAGAPKCAYDLTTLEAGASWCVVTVAYDDAGVTSAPSNPTCAALPPHCP
jgi:hypothetical protein